jgi:hypothetical protein
VLNIIFYVASMFFCFPKNISFSRQIDRSHGITTRERQAFATAVRQQQTPFSRAANPKKKPTKSLRRPSFQRESDATHWPISRDYSG